MFLKQFCLYYYYHIYDFYQWYYLEASTTTINYKNINLKDYLSPLMLEYRTSDFRALKLTYNINKLIAK